MTAHHEPARLGTRLVRSWYPKPEEFSASKDGCDVRMGPYRFTGDLHEYRITGAADELWVDIQLEGITESWRPETGNLLFGPNDQYFFAWTPFVPQYEAGAMLRSWAGDPGGNTGAVADALIGLMDLPLPLSVWIRG